MEKKQILQDELYQFFKNHNFIYTRLGEMIGLDISSITSCFKHLYANGKPRYFTRKALEKINEALPQMAREVERGRIVFIAANNVSKQKKVMYDPGCVEQIRALGRWFKVDSLCQRVLGWKPVKSRKVLFAPSSMMYGHVSLEDVNRLNEELMFVSFWLQSHEVVHADDIKPADADAPTTDDEHPGYTDVELDVYEEQLLMSEE